MKLLHLISNSFASSVKKKKLLIADHRTPNVLQHVKLARGYSNANLGALRVLIRCIPQDKVPALQVILGF